MIASLNVFYFDWEFSFLYALQGIRTDALDSIMSFFSDLGNYGAFWMILATIFLLIPKYRKMGLQSWITIAVVFIIGNLILKNAFMRARPCQIDSSVALLVKIPTDASFPSGHTMNGYAASLTFLFYDKRIGIPAVILATLIAFSRMYNFMHFPTDVLGGFVLALCVAILVNYLMNKFWKKEQSAA